MILSQHVDWLAFTVPYWARFELPLWMSKPTKAIKARNGYNVAFENDMGVKIYQHDKRPEMGTHVVLSGSVMAAYVERETELLKWVIAGGFKVTRIDMALDVKDSDFRPELVTRKIEKHEHRTHARNFPLWKDAIGRGFTQYIGKKSSETFVRIYDKAAEMAISGNWTRIEITFTGSRALSATKTYMESKDCRGLVRGFVDFPTWEQWRKIMSSDVQKITVEKTISDTRKWLLGQCAPALAKEMIKDGDDTFYFMFIQRVRDSYNEPADD